VGRDAVAGDLHELWLAGQGHLRPRRDPQRIERNRSARRLRGQCRVGNRHHNATNDQGSTPTASATTQVTAPPTPPTPPNVSKPTATIRRLISGTTYHYRLVAFNTTGTSLGADRTLRTKATPKLKKHKK
jgi:hypothetical protein